MSFAPQQDWDLYRRLTADAEAERLRNMSPAERFAIYCSLFDTIRHAREVAGDYERLENDRWREKLALRQRMVEAYTKRDVLLRERAAKHNPA